MRRRPSIISCQADILGRIFRLFVILIITFSFSRPIEFVSALPGAPQPNPAILAMMNSVDQASLNRWLAT